MGKNREKGTEKYWTKILKWKIEDKVEGLYFGQLLVYFSMSQLLSVWLNVRSLTLL